MITTTYKIEIASKGADTKWRNYYINSDKYHWEDELNRLRTWYPGDRFRVIKKQVVMEEIVEVIG